VTCKYQLFGPLDEAAYAALREDIEARGVLVPVEEDEHGSILDGHNRAAIARELGIDYPRLIRAGLTEEEKRSHVRKVNLLRRHLDREQKRMLIAEQLKDTPLLSDRQVAAMLGVHHTTVGTTRLELVRSGELANLASSLGADGKERPRERVPRTALATSKQEAAEVQSALLDLGESKPEEDAPPPIQTADAVKKQARKATQPQAPETPTLPPERYSLILADPPWKTNFRRGTGRDFENHYAPMDLEAIKALDVPSISAPDSILFLWAVSMLLPEALEVMKEWGFTFKASAVWVKDRMGMGFYWRLKHEYLLVGTNGAPGVPAYADRFESVIYAERGAHSEKPVEVHEMIETMYPNARRIELFARAARPGWTLWGAEAPIP